MALTVALRIEFSHSQRIEYRLPERLHDATLDLSGAA
jgi:hypothetical protein